MFFSEKSFALISHTLKPVVWAESDPANIKQVTKNNFFILYDL
jgi:hypothetical protein